MDPLALLALVLFFFAVFGLVTWLEVRDLDRRATRSRKVRALRSDRRDK